MIRGHENLKFITQACQDNTNWREQQEKEKKEENEAADAKNLILHTHTHTHACLPKRVLHSNKATDSC